MTAVYFCGMAATVVLTFGVYGTLDAVWGPPMSNSACQWWWKMVSTFNLLDAACSQGSFVPSFGLLRMDMDFLSFSCVLGRKSFTSATRHLLILFAWICMDGVTDGSIGCLIE